MALAVSLCGLGFNLEKVAFDSKKRALENFGYSVKELNFNDRNIEFVDKLYKMTSPVVEDAYKTSNDQLEAWLRGEDNKCTDGKDDGHINIFSKVWNFIEGSLKTAVGSLHTLSKDKKKLAKFVTTAAIMAGIAVFGGPVGAAVVGIIGFVGACGLINNGIKDFVNAAKIADSATTDAQAKAAFEQMGSGALQVGVGVICAKQTSTSLLSEYEATEFADAFCSNLEDISILADKS
ncbi:hypothetical protein IKQ26_09090 [bacterium]|nr:hypothetical protein [bacterium]